MNLRQTFELLLLAAIWGSSFLFMRISVAEFGAAPLAATRVWGAALMLVPLVAMRGELASLRVHWRPVFWVGLFGSGLPFFLFGWAANALSTGVMSILNATTPMWGAAIVWLWLGEKLSALRVLGLLVGTVGVAWLAWDNATIKTGDHGVVPALAIGACLLATLGYGFVAALIKKKLVGVPPMAIAAGSQLGAAVALTGPAMAQWPIQAPGTAAWISALTLAALCTGVAYVLYYRLVTTVGASNAMTVTFLIPLFAVLWGAIFLNEAVTVSMLAAGGLILLGTGLSTGALGPKRA